MSDERKPAVEPQAEDERPEQRPKSEDVKPEQRPKSERRGVDDLLVAIWNKLPHVLFRGRVRTSTFLLVTTFVVGVFAYGQTTDYYRQRDAETGRVQTTPTSGPSTPTSEPTSSSVAPTTSTPFSSTDVPSTTGSTWTPSPGTGSQTGSSPSTPSPSTTDRMTPGLPLPR